MNASVRFHGRDVAAARETWKQLIESHEADRWVYRADWAWSQTSADGGKTTMRSDQKNSLLGRIGYLGRGNPDLVAR